MVAKKLLWAAAIMVVGLQSCSPVADTLVVMSYNIRNSAALDGENAWELRRSATPAMLASVKPDIFGVQEALSEQEAYILDMCPEYAAYGVGRNDGVDDGERVTVFYRKSRLELLDKGTWWLSETPDVPSVGWDAKYPRTATWMLLFDKKKSRKFYFVNTHLDHKGALARRFGLSLLMDKIKEMNPDTPLVLVGDLNVEPGDECLEDVELRMQNARTSAAVSTQAPSSNGFGKGRKKMIDYIYFSGFGGAESFKVVSEEFDGKPFISDHWPVVAELYYKR